MKRIQPSNLTSVALHASVIASLLLEQMNDMVWRVL